MLFPAAVRNGGGDIDAAANARAFAPLALGLTSSPASPDCSISVNAAFFAIGAFPVEPSTDTSWQTLRGANEPVHASDV